HGEPRVAGRLRRLRHTRLLRLFPRRIPEGPSCSSCARSALSDAPDGPLWSRQGRCHLVRRRPVSRRPPAYPPRLIPALARSASILLSLRSRLALWDTIGTLTPLSVEILKLFPPAHRRDTARARC